MYDDRDIMERVQRGDFAAFDQLVLRYRGALLRVAAHKLGHAALAEDVVQEAFLAAFAARRTYKPEFAFRTWLWTILLNLCRRHALRGGNRPREIAASGLGVEAAVPLHEPAVQETGLSQLLCTERRERVLALLARLPEVQADALRLRFFGGLKFQEIAEVMDSSLGAAKIRVKHGLQTLSELIGAEEGEP